MQFWSFPGGEVTDPAFAFLCSSLVLKSVLKCWRAAFVRLGDPCQARVSSRHITLSVFVCLFARWSRSSSCSRRRRCTDCRTTPWYAPQYLNLLAVSDRFSEAPLRRFSSILAFLLAMNWCVNARSLTSAVWLVRFSIFHSIQVPKLLPRGATFRFAIREIYPWTDTTFKAPVRTAHPLFSAVFLDLRALSL